MNKNNMDETKKLQSVVTIIVTAVIVLAVLIGVIAENVQNANRKTVRPQIDLSQYLREWKNVELSGEWIFDRAYQSSSHGFVKGSGQTQYSFASERSIDSGGDIELLVSLENNYKKVDFYLEGYKRYDQGPLQSPPVQFKLEERDNSSMTIGHYYVLVKEEPSHVLLVQIEDFQYSLKEKSDIFTSLFGNKYSYTLYDTNCKLVFRYLAAANIKELEHVVEAYSLKLRRPKVVEEPRNPETRRAHPSEEKVINIDDLMQVVNLDYENLQKDSKSFFDVPTDQATVLQCNRLINKAEDLNTKIKTIIFKLETSIKENGMKISNLTENLQTLKDDSQLQDRVQTKIQKLKEATDNLQMRLEEWMASLVELQALQQQLKKYAKILEI
jgi:hypothetical protein